MTQRAAPIPSETQRHPRAIYLLCLRPTHEEAERIKAAVAQRCLLGQWAPDTDDADWALQWLVAKILEAQGITMAERATSPLRAVQRRTQRASHRQCPGCLRFRHDRSKLPVCPQCRALRKEMSDGPAEQPPHL